MNKTLLSALAVIATVSVSQAQTYTFDTTPTGTNNSAGVYKHVNSVWNSSTDDLKFTAVFGKNGSTVPDGFWLVLSPGPNPKGIDNQLAILYFDASKSGTPTLTAYNYNGVNGDTSYKDGNGKGGAPGKIVSSLLDNTFVKSISSTTAGNGDKTFAFDINATKIQKYSTASTWTGVSFAQQVGIWFHAVNGLSTSYQNGFLKSFSYGCEGYFDGSNFNTSVPEPFALVALGIGGLIAARKRKKA